jgi:hypothetical protein
MQHNLIQLTQKQKKLQKQFLKNLKKLKKMKKLFQILKKKLKFYLIGVKKKLIFFQI